MLKLTAICTGVLLFTSVAIGAKAYSGAELYSKGVVKYGRFDVRMRAVSGSGVVSSFFLYYNDSYLGSPQPWQELDFEIIGKNKDEFQSNIITGTAESKKTSEQLHKAANIAVSYHTYTYEWTPDYIAWLFDGVEVRRSTGAQVTACQQKDMSYRFNLWISDVPSWVGQFDPAILPVYQFINWVKFSKYTPGTGPNGSDFTKDWQDDFNQFESTLWAKGNWTFDGNIVDFSPDNIIVKDGYCIIGLTKAGVTGYSGTVPQDQPTAVLPEQSSSELKFINRAAKNQVPSFLLSLDGRVLGRRLESHNQANAGLWIARENGTVSRTITIAK